MSKESGEKLRIFFRFSTPIFGFCVGVFVPGCTHFGVESSMLFGCGTRRELFWIFRFWKELGVRGRRVRTGEHARWQHLNLLLRFDDRRSWIEMADVGVLGGVILESLARESRCGE